MRRIIIFAIVVLLVLSACNQNEDMARVRFRNRTPDVVILHGIRLGEAQHVGQLSPGQDSAYSSSSPGDYYVELRGGDGTWVAVAGTYSVEAGKRYAVELWGSYYGGVYFSLSEE